MVNRLLKLVTTKMFKNPMSKRSCDFNHQEPASNNNDHNCFSNTGPKGGHSGSPSDGIDKIAIENFTNLNDIHLNITSTAEQTLEWIKKHKLIPGDGTPCPKCVERESVCIGVLKYYNIRGKCRRKGNQSLCCCGAGRSCRKRYSPFTDTVFDGIFSKITLDKVIELIYCWIHRFRVIDAVREVGVRNKGVVTYFQFFRGICGHTLLDSVSQIGGPGKVVLIAYSTFKYRKFSNGWPQNPFEDGLVFGGYEKDSNRVFMVRVPNIDELSLVPIIRAYIKPGSIIATEHWRTYSALDGYGLRSFVSPKDPRWKIFDSELNWYTEENKAIEELREGYLQEYLYRRAHKDIVQDFFHRLRIYCRHPFM